jgi:O-antigen/teichoic acid export membrane protein
MKNFTNHLLTSGLILATLGLFVLIFTSPYYKIALYVMASAFMLWNVSMIYRPIYEKIQKIRNGNEPESSTNKTLL